MRKSIVLLLVLALVGSALSAPAVAGKKKKKKKKPKRIERVVEFEYACPCAGLFQLGGLTGGDPNLGGGPVQTGADENFLTAVAEDDLGMPVHVDVQGDTDGDGFNNAIGSFCGETEEPIEIPAGIQLNIFVNGMGQCDDGSPAVGIGGTITFTLSNLP